MRALYIDCACSEPQIGLITAQQMIDSKVDRNPDDKRGLLLFAGIISLLNEQKLQFTDLTAIAVNNGPGPMTGTRVGLATAIGLAIALDLPVVPLPNQSDSGKSRSTEAVSKAFNATDSMHWSKIQPIYAREPDAEPQFDAFGRPLASRVTI